MGKQGKKKTKVGSGSADAALAVAEGDHFYGRCVTHADHTLLDGIDYVLYRDDFQALTNSQLGGTVFMGSRNKFASQLVHYAMLWQLKTNKAHETWYALQGNKVRFSLEEFALVTGLDCSPPPPELMEGEHKDAVFRLFRRDKVSVNELEHAWAMEKDTQAGVLMRKYKLALLVLVEGILFGSDKNTRVRGWVVKLLLKDTGRFLKFPWGRLVYERTHESIAGALEKLVDAGKSKGQRPTYTLYGFPMAFQVNN